MKKKNQETIEILKAFIIERREIWKIIGNENRINILYGLYERDQTWSELMFSLRINPKALRDHLHYLINYKMVFKNDGFYSLTKLGRNICELRFVQDIHAQLVL